MWVKSGRPYYRTKWINRSIDRKWKIVKCFKKSPSRKNPTILSERESRNHLHFFIIDHIWWNRSCKMINNMKNQIKKPLHWVQKHEKKSIFKCTRFFMSCFARTVNVLAYANKWHGQKRCANWTNVRFNDSNESHKATESHWFMNILNGKRG